MAKPKLPFQYETLEEAKAAGAGSPSAAAFNAWAKTAQSGDVYDWGETTGFQNQTGLQSKLVGYNDAGKPIYETIMPESQKNWRDTIGNTAGMSYQEALNTAIGKLVEAGVSPDVAKYLAARKLGGPNMGDTLASIGGPVPSSDGNASVSNNNPVNENTATTNNSSSTASSQNVMTGANSSTVNPYMAGSEAAKNWDARKSAYDLLYSEFNKYGLGSLVQPLQKLVMENVSPSEFAIELANSPAYQQRFSANKERIAKGLRALSPAEYVSLEDQYQNIMRNYGLPASYYTRDSIGTQSGFNQFISNDVSAAELEDRIATAQKRIQYANPEVGIALKTFYPDITNGDVLAYVLDPKNALENIKRRITAAEIGGTAVSMGLTSNETDAEYLARYGVTKQQAQQGYQTIAGILPRASQLSDIYAQQGVNPYTQATAEKEVFGVPGAADAERQRKKLVDLEKAAFSGSSGSSGGALARERAGSF